MRSIAGTAPRDSGVALLEALISVAIIMAGVSSALFAIRQAVSAQSSLEKQSVCLRLAEQQLALIRVHGAGSSGSESAHPFPPPNDSYSWSATSVQVSDAPPLFSVTVKIIEQRSGKTIVGVSALMP